MPVRRVFLHLFAGLMLCAIASSSHAEDAQSKIPYVPFEGEHSTWHEGFRRYDFLMDGDTMALSPIKQPANEGTGIGAPPKGSRRCVVICPKQPAPGNPWSWQGCYWNHQPQAEVELLRRGFHIAYISADATLKPDKYWDSWYSFLTKEHGLSPKPAFIGMSRGGEYEFTWGTTHPDRVSAIYADNPGISDEALGKLRSLAVNDVPILLVCGTIDPILSRFGLTIESVYRQMGGRVSTILKEGAGHHPHSLQDPKPIADFIEQAFQAKKPAVPDFVGSNPYERFSYYGVENTVVKSAKESYLLVRRGPAFAESYDRYEVNLGFPWPVSIIAPRIPAKGKPWVLRADFVDREATVDQALLAKGFHIVTGPVGFGVDGPVLAEWDKLYGYLTDHGFSRRPVMEGAGGAAGAVYEWAIQNPGKVSCVYAENPILDIPNSTKPPLENLAPLAAAKVPLLHVCARLDPSLESQTRVAEKRYRRMGGSLNVVFGEREGHSLPYSKETKAVVDFILAHQ